MFDQFPGIDVEQIFLYVYRLITGGSEDVTLSSIKVAFWDVWTNVAIASAVITALLIAALAYTIVKSRRMHLEESMAYKAKAQPRDAKVAPKHAAWQRVLELAASDRPSDWRIAVLDADVMLDELVTAEGYVGENLGEKLKSIARGDMRTLEQAWEAHKVRNQIAHGGGDYILTQREARRAIEMFRQVFEELGAI